MNTVTIQTLGGDAIISECDYDRVEENTWHLWNTYLFCNKLKKSLHHFIIGMRPIDIPDDWVVDHANRNDRDASRPNLRWVSPAFNNWNKAKKKNTASRFVGVSWKKANDKWQARCARKHIGYFKTEIEAAKAVAKQAVLLWGEWASKSDLLFGPGLLTEGDLTDIKNSIGSATMIRQENTRSLPRGVAKSTGSQTFEARCARHHIGSYKTVEQASLAYENYVKKKHNDKWSAHLLIEIKRDQTGDAVIPLMGKHSKGHQAKCPDHLWHKLTFNKSWYLDGKYACGSWEGKKDALHRVIFKLCNPDWNLKCRVLTVDHIVPENKLDNRECNLRAATNSLQAYNRGKKKGTINTYIGVTRTRSNKWEAQVMKDGVRYCAGYAFNTQNEAARALNAKAIEIYGKDARLIDIVDDPEEVSVT